MRQVVDRGNSVKDVAEKLGCRRTLHTWLQAVQRGSDKRRDEAVEWTDMPAGPQPERTLLAA